MTETAAATVAIVLYAVGVVMLFGVRSWQQKRATGSAGFNGFTADRGPAARMAGLSFAAAVVAGLISPVLVLVGVLPAVPLAPAAALVGLVLAVAGYGLAVLAQQTMGRSWRIGVDPKERTDLITHGVFGYVRNPIFTAMIAAQTGTTLLAPLGSPSLGPRCSWPGSSCKSAGSRNHTFWPPTAPDMPSTPPEPAASCPFLEEHPDGRPP